MQKLRSAARHCIIRVIGVDERGLSDLKLPPLDINCSLRSRGLLFDSRFLGIARPCVTGDTQLCRVLVYDWERDCFVILLQVALRMGHYQLPVCSV